MAFIKLTSGLSKLCDTPNKPPRLDNDVCSFGFYSSLGTGDSSVYLLWSSLSLIMSMLIVGIDSLLLDS